SDKPARSAAPIGDRVGIPWRLELPRARNPGSRVRPLPSRTGCWLRVALLVPHVSGERSVLLIMAYREVSGKTREQKCFAGRGLILESCRVRAYSAAPRAARHEPLIAPVQIC